MSSPRPRTISGNLCGRWRRTRLRRATSSSTKTPITPPAVGSVRFGRSAEELAMEERRKKAFDFAADATKQLVTLAIGVVTLTITFAKDVVKVASGPQKVLLTLAWIVYLLSIVS